MRNNGLDYSGMMAELDILCRKYRFSQSVIGHSLVGRELPLISVGEGSRAVLFVGTHHAMEHITTALLLDFLSELGEAEKETARLLDGRTLYIVPMLNPDGVELHIHGKDELNPLTDRLTAMSGGDYSRWQANGRGVDLNHNYDAGFYEYKEYERQHGISPGATLFSGEYPESEPESAALCGFIRARGIDLLVALHTQGEEIYYDYGGIVPENGEKIARQLASLTGYTLSEPSGSAAFGGLKDWFIKEYSLPGFTIECGKGVNPLPITDTELIYPRIRDALYACIAAV